MYILLKSNNVLIDFMKFEFKKQFAKCFKASSRHVFKLFNYRMKSNEKQKSMKLFHPAKI